MFIKVTEYLIIEYITSCNIQIIKIVYYYMKNI